MGCGLFGAERREPFARTVICREVPSAGRVLEQAHGRRVAADDPCLPRVVDVLVAVERGEGGELPAAWVTPAGTHGAGVASWVAGPAGGAGAPARTWSSAASSPAVSGLSRVVCGARYPAVSVASTVRTVTTSWGAEFSMMARPSAGQRTRRIRAGRRRCWRRPWFRAVRWSRGSSPFLPDPFTPADPHHPPHPPPPLTSFRR